MGLTVQQNFDWSITDRRIVMFIPNYHRPEQVEFGIRNMVTHLPKDDWVIIIGNDLCHYDFSHLKDLGVYSFSLDTGRSKCRNSAFIRNYAIKRCQSKIFFQKDPEIIVNGDYLKRAAERGLGWKTGYVLGFPKGPTRDILERGVSEIIPFLKEHNLNPEVQGDLEYKALGGGIFQITLGINGLSDPEKLHKDVLSGAHNISNWLSYALGIETKVLQEMRGYDESFTSYGYEDSDMICRLMAKGYSITPDYNCTSIHLHHPSTVDPYLQDMKQIFVEKQPKQIIRNPLSWGEGV